MNAEMKQFLSAHKLSYMKFARLFGVSRRTAIYWAQGQARPPNSVFLLMRAIQGGMVKIEWAQDEVERIQWGG